MPSIKAPDSTTEPWYAPELRALATVFSLFSPILVAALPSTLMWGLRYTRFPKKASSSSWLALASTVLCLLLCVDMAERRPGFLAWPSVGGDGQVAFFACVAMFQIASVFIYMVSSPLPGQRSQASYTAIPLEPVEGAAAAGPTVKAD